MTDAPHREPDASASADSDGPEATIDDPSRTTAASATPAPPVTGDPVVDAALHELAETPAEDLDAQLAAGESVHRTLQSRLSGLGG